MMVIIELRPIWLWGPDKSYQSNVTPQSAVEWILQYLSVLQYYASCVLQYLFSCQHEKNSFQYFYWTTREDPQHHCDQSDATNSDKMPEDWSSPGMIAFPLGVLCSGKRVIRRHVQVKAVPDWWHETLWGQRNDLQEEGRSVYRPEVNRETVELLYYRSLSFARPAG